MPPYSLYIHIPFCRQRCGYCDFNTYAGLEALILQYVRALCAEIRHLASLCTSRLAVHTIYFGGGTPSLLPIHALETVLAALQTAFDILPNSEITLESNPGTLSPAYLHALRHSGINRLSLGMQSAHPGELRLLGRIHTYEDVIQSVTWARQAGFDNLNLDLIFGLPEQAMETWQRSLDLALGLHPEHLSLYALTIEHGTPFGHWAARGALSSPDPDLAADMYEWATERLEKSGYAQYEISNWAKHSTQGLLTCRHNLQYWRDLPYLGFGAGAHGYAGRIRTANVLSPAEYIQRIEGGDQRSAISNQQSAILNPNSFPLTPATHSAQAIDQATEMAEMMMVGLRLTHEGVSSQIFLERFGQTLNETYGPQIERLIRLGLLEWAEDALRITPHGRLLGNQVFMEFV